MGQQQVARCLGTLAEAYALGEAQQAQLAAFLEALCGDPRAPTAVREPRRALEVHLADALSALELVTPRRGDLLVDIGSGAGLPGVPLAVALPQARVILLESQARRCSFLRQVCRHAGVGNAEVVCARAECWQDGLGRCDIALARAIAPPPVVLEYAAPLLKPGGVLVDWRGRADEGTERSRRAAAELLGLRCEEPRRAVPFQGAEARYLHLYEKVRATPDRFPRRAGVARKRPLGVG